MFIDETWIKTNMIKLYGRCPQEERLVDHAPRGHWKTLTFIGALRNTGMTAPMVMDHAIDGNSFKEWVKHCLVPTLKKGDIVVMDNLSSHKSPVIRKLIRAVKAKLFYLPVYSPDLNPIENCFSKIKAKLRTAQQRTVDGILDALKPILNSISPTEASAYFNHAGYAT